MRMLFPIGVVVACFSAALSFSQSLGDIARQQRFLKPAPTARVITNEDIAARSGKKDQLARADITPAIEISIPKRDSKQQSPADVQSKILAQKQKVKQLEDRIAADKKQLAKHDPIGNSGVSVYERVTFQGSLGLGSPGVGFCALPDYILEQRGLKDWCDEPDKLEADIAAAQKELAVERTSLDAMQEEARQQGFGNSIYDPD